MKKIPLRITWETVLQYAAVTAGSLFFALGELIFIKSMHIPMGGISGISLVLNYLWALPVGLMNLVLNIPLYFIGWKNMGRRFFFKTVFSTVASSVFLDLLDPKISGFAGETLLSALYGGIVMGIGFGLIFRAGGTSGGSDIISKWIHKKTDLPVGTLNFIIDIVVIIGSSLIYRNPDSALYAILTSYVTNQVVDKMVYGMDVQKQAMIITSRPEAVADQIMTEMERGVTGMDAVGMYTGDERKMLLCVVRRHEVGMLKKIIQTEDPGAFLMLSELNEVFGLGFKRLGQ